MDAYEGKRLLAFLSVSLSESQALQPSHAVFDFLDKCLTRLSKKVVKYLQDFLELSAQSGVAPDQEIESPIGALLIVMMEQWPFIQEFVTAHDIDNLSRWFSCFLEILAKYKGGSKLISHARTHLTSITKDQQCKTTLERCPDINLPTPNLDLQLNTPTLHEIQPSAPPTSHMRNPNKRQQSEPDEWQPPLPPSPENENHPALTKWKTLPLDDAIHVSAIADLFLCLSSHHRSIRTQGLQHLRSLAQTLKSSSHPDRPSLYLLFGSLIETASHSDLTSIAIPYFTTVLAGRMAVILTEPLHVLFEKINTFLLKKGPVWDLQKLPSYWVDRVFLHTPTSDDDDGAVYREQEWLLLLLIDGLRTAQDMELYRTSHILEKVMAALGNGYAPAGAKEKVLGLLWRCTDVKGGATTLVTRYGVLSWGRGVVAGRWVEGRLGRAMERLVRRCEEKCDGERVGEWSGGAVGAREVIGNETEGVVGGEDVEREADLTVSGSFDVESL